jgi:mRNA interferase MazF
MSIQRSQIYFVNLDPTQGREQAGARPVLVVSIDEINQQPLVITVIVGTKGENIRRDHPTNIRVTATESGLPLETVFLGFQIRSLDSKRFPPKPAGQLSPEKMAEVEAAMRYCLGL